METDRGESFGGQKALQQPRIDDKLLAGEYRLRLRGPISVDYLGRTTAQEMAIGGGRRLVFWAPETLVKLRIPKGIALGAGMVRSLDQVIDAETGRALRVGIGVVMRREGMDQEVYVRILAGTLTLDSRTLLTGRLRCEVANATGENLEVDQRLREIGHACWTRGHTALRRVRPQASLRFKTIASRPPSLIC